MKKETGAMTVDTGDFDKGLADLVAMIGLKGIQPGLFQAGNALLKDAIYTPPQAPKDVGDLRASARTQGADGVLHKAGTRPRSAPVTSGHEVGIRAGFNIAYAAKWHETKKKINWTTDKGARFPGPKYLELKMRFYHERYMTIIGEYIKSVLAKKGKAGGE